MLDSVTGLSPVATTRSALMFLAFAAAWLAAGCTDPVLDPTTSHGERDVGLEVEPVVGGKMAAQCAWPSTISINGCTGTLIHPRVITTAAHCIENANARISFTAGVNMPGSFSVMGRCKAGARGSSGVASGNDWAYCVLPEDARVAQMPITAPLVGCEAEKFLKPGAMAWVVGFGTTGPSGQGSGVKREVEVKINKVSSGVLDIGDRAVGACHGDSGGPLYVQLSDGTHDWGLRVAGSTSGPGDNRCDCTCSTTYVNIAQHVKAIETNENIDVTPCTDATGNWAPGPDCHDFQRAPEMASGAYPTCAVMKTVGPIDSCGSSVATAGGAGGAGGVVAGSGGTDAGRAGNSAGMTGAAGGGVAGAGGVVSSSAGAGAGAAGVGAAGAGAVGAGAAGQTASSGGAGAAAFDAGTAGAIAGAPHIGTNAGAVGAAGSFVAGAPGNGFTVPAKRDRGAGCSVASPSTKRRSLLGWLFLVLPLSFLSARRRRCVHGGDG